MKMNIFAFVFVMCLSASGALSQEVSECNSRYSVSSLAGRLTGHNNREGTAARIRTGSIKVEAKMARLNDDPALCSFFLNLSGKALLFGTPTQLSMYFKMPENQGSFADAFFELPPAYEIIYSSPIADFPFFVQHKTRTIGEFKFDTSGVLDSVKITTSLRDAPGLLWYAVGLSKKPNSFEINFTNNEIN